MNFKIKTLLAVMASRVRKTIIKCVLCAMDDTDESFYLTKTLPLYFT